jgi:hypothetical protein
MQAVNFSSYDAYRKLLTKCYGSQASERGSSFLAGAMAGVAIQSLFLPHVCLTAAAIKPISAEFTSQQYHICHRCHGIPHMFPIGCCPYPNLGSTTWQQPWSICFNALHCEDRGLWQPVFRRTARSHQCGSIRSSVLWHLRFPQGTRLYPLYTIGTVCL